MYIRARNDRYEAYNQVKVSVQNCSLYDVTNFHLYIDFVTADAVLNSTNLKTELQQTSMCQQGYIVYSAVFVQSSNFKDVVLFMGFKYGLEITDYAYHHILVNEKLNTNCPKSGPWKETRPYERASARCNAFDANKRYRYCVYAADTIIANWASDIDTSDCHNAKYWYIVFGCVGGVILLVIAVFSFFKFTEMRIKYRKQLAEARKNTVEEKYRAIEKDQAPKYMVGNNHIIAPVNPKKTDTFGITPTKSGSMFMRTEDTHRAKRREQRTMSKMLRANSAYMGSIAPLPTSAPPPAAYEEAVMEDMTGGGMLMPQMPLGGAKPLANELTD